MIIDRDRGVVAIEWNVADVVKVIDEHQIKFNEPLNEEECFEVLLNCIRNLRGNRNGINKGTIYYWINKLYSDRIVGEKLIVTKGGMKN